MPARAQWESGSIFPAYSDRGHGNPILPFPIEDSFMPPVSMEHDYDDLEM